MRIGFALVPDQQFIEKVMEAVNGLARQGIFLNSLGYTGNIPNIILFQGNFNKKFQFWRCCCFNDYFSFIISTI